MGDGELILIAGALLVAGLAASLVADRVRVPGLVLFLVLGMLIGSDGLGLIEFDDYELARSGGVIALALILFEGGMTAGFREIRPVLVPSLSLAFLGTVITAVVCGLTAAWLFDLTTLEGMLIGATLSCTDGAAIFALLRQSTLRRRVARTLEGESGFNDPIAVLLVLACVDAIQEPDYGIADVFTEFGVELGIGLAVGLLVGRLAVRGFTRARLATTGLYPVASLATAAVAFGAADALHGSGFLAVYLAGLALGDATIPAKRTILAFHQGIAWVAQLSLFLALGLLVFPSRLDEVWVEGTVLAVVLVLVARPLAAFVATTGMRYTPAERLVLGWAGLKGAIPVVLATFPVIEGVEGAEEIFDIVFFAVLASTLVQGSTFEPLAARLGVTTDEPALPEPIAEAGAVRRLGAEVLDFPVAPGDAVIGAPVRELGLPREATVTVIVRGGQAIPPRGSTLIREGDTLHVLYREESARELPDLLRRWRTGPLGRAARAKRVTAGKTPIFMVRMWEDARDGDPAHPSVVNKIEVIDQLRVRRDKPGGLFLLADGRYAVCGPLLAVGSRRSLVRWATGRMAVGVPDERAWMRTIVGALAAEVAERTS